VYGVDRFNDNIFKIFEDRLAQSVKQAAKGPVPEAPRVAPQRRVIRSRWFDRELTRDWLR
jgi:hypothetical protein